MNGGPLVLSKASGVPFYRQLRDQLDDRIRSGVLPPGHPLPSIRELAAQLLVSVITVKSAYEELEAQGLIASRQGRGTFVADNATAASKKHFESQIARELASLAQRAASVGVEKDRLQALCEDALRKAYKGKER
ncbi:MAG TPA: GntR family transcriptional regulator [Labilithrix sp.]|jgi:GntR family transcriptional regulator|nr:GntR family transcriptional regulator [Labilithrix sp.]